MPHTSAGLYFDMFKLLALWQEAFLVVIDAFILLINKKWINVK